MNADEQSSWWPEKPLRSHPVRRVYVCGRHLEPPVYSHVVNFPRLEIPLSGCYENQIEGKERPLMARLGPGTALFAAPNCWNLPSWRHRVRLMSLLFGKKQLGISIVAANGGANPALTAQKFSLPRPVTGPLPKILEAMIELEERASSRGPAGELVRALCAVVEVTIGRRQVTVPPRAGSVLVDVCVCLQNHYQYYLTRDSVARQFGISPNHLSRLFQVQGHMTFRNYLMHVRTDRAKYLLRTYNFKLDDIASRCGYQDTAYFCRVFRKLAKVTPATYRAQLGKR